MHQGPAVVVIDEKKKFPYGCYIGLGITQIVLGVIGIACTAAKLGLICKGNFLPYCGYPGIAGYNGAVFFCCLMFVVAGIIGVCVNSSQKKKRVCLGSAFCGLSVFCIVLAIFVWLAAATEAVYSPGFLLYITLFGQIGTIVTAIDTTSYLIWIVGFVGFLEFILAIVSSSVWCCTCCGSFKEKEQNSQQAYQMGPPGGANYNQGYYPGPQLASHPNQQYNQNYDIERQHHGNQPKADHRRQYDKTDSRDSLYRPYGHNQGSSGNPDMYMSNEGNYDRQGIQQSWGDHGRHIDGYPGYGRY